MIIYRLISPSGKSYIGKTNRNFEKRFQEHTKTWKKGIKTKLYDAFTKYVPETWKVEILYCCLNEEELNDKEKYYIKYYDSIDHGYNLCRGGGGGGMLGQNHSAETKRKMRESSIGRIISEDQKRKISESCKGRISPTKGKIFSEETKRKMSESHINPSEETKIKMSESHIGLFHSENQKRKISVAVKKIWEERGAGIRPMPVY